jgi:hypothetical protein
MSMAGTCIWIARSIKRDFIFVIAADLPSQVIQAVSMPLSAQRLYLTGFAGVPWCPI